MDKPEVRKRPGVYLASVMDYRLKAQNRLRAARSAYLNLSDRTSGYAREIKALVELHEKVAAIWFQAPDEVQPQEEAPCSA
jgi:hypothetical protein